MLGSEEAVMGLVIFILFLAATITFIVEFIMTRAIIALGLALGFAAFTVGALAGIGG